MAENVEQRTAHPGYALVELQAKASGDQPAADDKLTALRRRLESLQADAGRARNELHEIERAAHAAVEAEDAARVAATWDDKRRLQSRVTELQQEQTETRRQLEAEVRTALAELRQTRADIERQQAQQDAAWRQVIASAEELVRSLREADQRRIELNQREQAWHARLERLASSELNVLPEPRLAPAAQPRTPPASGKRRSVRAPEGKTVPRQWSVYDPDSGRIVSNLAELRPILARWYPNLHSEQERVHEFLELRNTEPLPERLRQELQEAGYLGTPDAAAEG